MAKYDGILICTDLDGTLSDKNGIISKENAEAIRYFKANGGKFTLSTGRSAPFFMGDNTVFTRSGLEFLPNVPVVTHNGASVFDFEKMEYIYSVPLPGDEIEKTILKKACAEDEVEYVFISGENADSISIIRRCEHDDFEKAVLEEAKSQNMKTELITNVSHDLKTPLTAIITYVDLLKKEDISIFIKLKNYLFEILKKLILGGQKSLKPGPLVPTPPET